MVEVRPRPNSDANDATVTLSVDHPLRAWKNVSDIEVTWLNNNDGTRKRLGCINPAENTFTLPPPHNWPHGMPGEYNISFPAGDYACYFENAIEMLDQPGEWYLDRQTGTLSYWPREGEDLTRAEVIAPVVQESLPDRRRSTGAPGEEFTIQGYSRGPRGLAAAALWLCGDVRVPGASGSEGTAAVQKVPMDRRRGDLQVCPQV